MTASTTHIVTPARVAVDTLSGFLRHKTEPIFTKDVFLAGLKANGRITYKETGVEMDWPVRYRRRSIEASDGYDSTVSTPRTVTRRRAKLPWRRYRLGESFTKFERLANAGGARMYDILGNLVGECVDDFLSDFRTKLYGDGNSTGSKDIHGLESIFSYSALINAAAKCGAPNDYYGQMYTTLGYYGGDWTADTSDYWPTGSGSAEYCFWSPLIVDSTNTNWTATTKTWANTWQECLAFAMAYQEMNQNEQFNFCLMNPQRLLNVKQSLESIQRLEVTQNSELTKLGLQTMRFEGLEIASQSGVPAATTYLFRWDKMSLRCMLPQLIDVEQDKDPNDSSDQYFFDCFCNLQFDSPAFFAKVTDIS